MFPLRGDGKWPENANRLGMNLHTEKSAYKEPAYKEFLVIRI